MKFLFGLLEFGKTPSRGPDSDTVLGDAGCGPRPGGQNTQ